MTIPYIEERKKLLALYEQADAIWSEQQATLEPLEAAVAEGWRKLIAEHEAAGGKWPGSLEDYSNMEKRIAEAADYKSAQQAVADAKAPFTARLEAVEQEVAKIEAVTGAISEDHWRGEGRAACAMTGLPILASDKVGIVLAEALPVTAAIHQSGS